MTYLTSQRGEVLWRGGLDAATISAKRWAGAALIVAGIGLVVGIISSDIRDAIFAAGASAMLARWWLTKQAITPEWLEVRERSVSWCLHGKVTEVLLVDIARIQRIQDIETKRERLVLQRLDGKALALPPLEAPYVEGYRVLHSRIPDKTPYLMPG